MSYEWIKIIALTLCGILFWCVMFTTFETKIKKSEEYQIFVRTAISDEEEVSLLCDKIKERALGHDVYKISYQIIDRGSTGDAQITARFMNYEGDMIFCEYLRDAEGRFSSDSSLMSYVDNGAIYDIDLLIEESIAYADAFYENGEVSYSKVSSDFRKRYKNSTRYNTESKIKKGIKKEVEKVEKIKTDAEKLKTYLQTYPDLRVNYQKNEHFNLANPDKQRELGEAKTYAINLSGLKDTTDYFQNKEQDASGIVVAPVAYKKTNGTRFYETVSALTYVIDYLRIQ